jgi:hypothetical protein
MMTLTFLSTKRKRLTKAIDYVQYLTFNKLLSNKKIDHLTFRQLKSIALKHKWVPHWRDEWEAYDIKYELEGMYPIQTDTMTTVITGTLVKLPDGTARLDNMETSFEKEKLPIPNRFDMFGKVE